MNKWIYLIDNGGGWNCMLNMSNLTKIYCDESQDRKSKKYFIIFRDKDKSQGHVTFSSQKKRDNAFENIQVFINLATASFLQIETDIR